LDIGVIPQTCVQSMMMLVWNEWFGFSHQSSIYQHPRHVCHRSLQYVYEAHSNRATLQCWYAA